MLKELIKYYSLTAIWLFTIRFTWFCCLSVTEYKIVYIQSKVLQVKPYQTVTV